MTAATTVPKNNQKAHSWQYILLTKPKLLPFPITFETNENLKWHRLIKLVFLSNSR